MAKDFAIVGVAFTRVAKRPEASAGAERQVRVVENARLKIEIDPYGIRSIHDKQTKQLVAQASPLHDSLVSLTLKRPGPGSTIIRDFYDAKLETCVITGNAESPLVTMVHRFQNNLS